MTIAQASIPDSFTNLWRVAGWFDEHEHAQKLCRALGYETDDDGVDLVRVAFVDRMDLFDAEEALIHPHMLFPA
ncbi:MAG: hypothetical protein E6Q67_03030 [Roseateles sp.]|nr:MAG: hypothetical protein E6Q67_03030 [Roseateles sp.]